MSHESRPDPTPATDQFRREVVELEKIRAQVLSDMEALRTQEENLRAYEARLRGSPPLVATTTATRPPLQANELTDLDALREKLVRTRALLEAERRALVDERRAIREERAQLDAKAAELRQREAWVQTRERDLAAKAMPPPVPRKAEPAGSAAPGASALGAARKLLSLRTRRATG